MAPSTPRRNNAKLLAVTPRTPRTPSPKECAHTLNSKSRNIKMLRINPRPVPFRLDDSAKLAVKSWVVLLAPLIPVHHAVYMLSPKRTTSLRRSQSLSACRLGKVRRAWCGATLLLGNKRARRQCHSCAKRRACTLVSPGLRASTTWRRVFRDCLCTVVLLTCHWYFGTRRPHCRHNIPIFIVLLILLLQRDLTESRNVTEAWSQSSCGIAYQARDRGAPGPRDGTPWVAGRLRPCRDGGSPSGSTRSFRAQCRGRTTGSQC